MSGHATTIAPTPGHPPVPGVRVRTVPLGGSALSRTLQDAAGASSWGMARPHSVEAWRDRCATTRADFSGDAWRTRLGDAITAEGAAAGRLARAVHDGVVVTTGQQPGLFGGPAYTLSKALSALALADELEAATGYPVAPVFWAATDDADWAEAAAVHVATAAGLRRLVLQGPPTEGVPMSEVPLGPMAELGAALAAACGSGAHPDALEAVLSAYRDGATVGGAYLAWLRAILCPLGIAVLDASHPALRVAADPVLRDALRGASPTSDALEARETALVAAGYAPQVELVTGRSLVFQSVPGEDGRSVRERVPLAAAARVQREAAPGSLGPNVLLRPVVERALLPTVAYVAGPGELAYGAQVPPVAEALGLRAPLFVPRWAGEVVDQRMVDTADALGLTEAELTAPHAAEARVARAHLDAVVADGVERLRTMVESQVRALGDAVGGAGLPLAPSTAEGLGRDLTRRIARHERRLLAAVKRRESETMRQVAVIQAALRPLGGAPERALTLVPLLVRHGPGVLARMQALAREHAWTLVRGASASG